MSCLRFEVVIVQFAFRPSRSDNAQFVKGASYANRRDNIALNHTPFPDKAVTKLSPCSIRNTNVFANQRRILAATSDHSGVPPADTPKSLLPVIATGATLNSPLRKKCRTIRQSSSRVRKIKLVSPTQVDATPIKFTLLNIRSLKSKSLLVREKIAEENIDLFLLTETWLTPSDNACVAECCPPNFSLHHVCRSGKIGGGVGIIARKSLHYSTVDVQHGDSFESLTIRSSNPALPLLTVVYRPPRPTQTNLFLLHQ